MDYVKILAGIALIGSIVWFIAEPGYEPGLAIVGSISTLISVFVIKKNRIRRVQQQQSVSKSSIGIQAGGDVSIGTIGGDELDK